LPPPFANTPGFTKQNISEYDENGPAWYWNYFTVGEHVGQKITDGSGSPCRPLAIVPKNRQLFLKIR